MTKNETHIDKERKKKIADINYFLIPKLETSSNL